jgi:hypothetical protein
MMPAFIDTKGDTRPEGAVIGRLLAGYGDLELSMCSCLVKMPGWDFDKAIKFVFGARGEKEADRSGVCSAPSGIQKCWPLI